MLSFQQLTKDALRTRLATVRPTHFQALNTLPVDVILQAQRGKNLHGLLVEGAFQSGRARTLK